MRDMRWLSIRRSVNDELRDLFDSIVKMYQDRKGALNGFQQFEFRTLCLKSMQNTSRVYRQSLRFTTDRIDFSDLITQWSYMFVFMLRHVHLVYYALDLTVQERICQVNPSGGPDCICMIGGGPGSDVLGFALFLMKHGCTAQLTSQVYVLDKCFEWSNSWRHLYRCLPDRYREGIPAVQYRPFDYLENKLTRQQLRCVEDADIVTMIKSLSPAAAWLKTKQKRYQYIRGANGQMMGLISEWHSVYEILKAMKPGAYLLYIDNETGPQRQILMDTVKYLNFDVLFDRVLRDVRMPNNFFSVFGCQLINAFNYKPCTMAGTNEVIILKKTISP